MYCREVYREYDEHINRRIIRSDSYFTDSKMEGCV